MQNAAVKKKARATYAEIVALPEHLVGEIIDGELVVSPRPAPRHAYSTSGVGMKLGPPFHFGDGGPGGWWILDEPELHLGEDVLVPDLAGWRRERMASLPRTAYFESAPDWVCEVLSPSTARHDRAGKLAIYAREGVGHAWLLDPIARTLEVFRREAGGWLLLAVHAGSARVRIPPFEAVELALVDFWGEDEDPPDESI